MKLDLNTGISLHIQGELGRYNSLPIDVLIRISQNLQELILSLAKNNVESNDSIHLDDFKVELFGFKKGSAIPQFIFTKRVQTSISDIDKQRTLVSKKFEELMNLSSKSAYLEINTLYPDSIRRNDIVDKLYDFTNSFGDSPTTIVDVHDINNSLKPLYPINRLKPEEKKSLTTKIVEVSDKSHEQIVVGTIKLITNKSGKTSKKIDTLYITNNKTLSFSPEMIVYLDTIYELNFPLHSSLEREDDYYVIHNEMLDIIGTGKTEEEAEMNFSEEFHYIYKRYNELSDDQLSDKLKRIKILLNHVVKTIN
jgi:predicted RNase H-like HicB family nuclease